MEIIDKTKDKKEEQWHLGDVLKYSDDKRIAMITKNNNSDYCLMDIRPDNAGNYSTNISGIWGMPYTTLEDLQEDYCNHWHKVNAKLVIEE